MEQRFLYMASPWSIVNPNYLTREAVEQQRAVVQIQETVTQTLYEARQRKERIEKLLGMIQEQVVALMAETVSNALAVLQGKVLEQDNVLLTRLKQTVVTLDALRFVDADELDRDLQKLAAFGETAPIFPGTLEEAKEGLAKLEVDNRELLLALVAAEREERPW